MTADSITVSGPNYTWQWSEKDDRFRILDQRGGVIASGMRQPVVVVQPPGQHGTPRCTAGKLAGHEVKENKATWTYTGVNGSSQLRVTWRFDEHGPWLHPVVYEASAAEDVVSVNYFAEAAGDGVKSALEANGLVLPGICESEAVSPITSDFIAWNTRSWLGRGAIGGASLLQQWGLPAHYFCGFRRSGPSESEAPEDRVRAFCCGLAELPKGDFFLEQQRGRASLCFDYRGDLWGHLR